MNPLRAPWLGLTTLFALATPVLASATAPPEVQAICKRISDMKLERTCLAMVETNRYDCPRTSHPELCEYMIRYVLPKQLYSKCSSLKAEGASSAEDNEVLCQAITRRNEMYCNRVHDEIGVTECRYMVRAFSALDVHAANAGAAADTADEPVTRSTSKMDWVTWEGEDPATAPVIWKMLLGDTEPENGNAQAMGVSIVQPGEIFDLHHHRQPEIYHVLSGEGIVEIGGVAKRAKAGDTFYIPGNAPHVTRTVGDKPFEWAFFFPFHSFDQVGYRKDPAREPKRPPTDESNDPHRFSVTDDDWATVTDEDFGERKMVSRTIAAGATLELPASENVSQAFVVSGVGTLVSGDKTIQLERQTASSLNPRTDKKVENTGGEPMVIMFLTGAKEE